MKFVLVKLLALLVFVFEHLKEKLNSQNPFDRPSAKDYPREIFQKDHWRKFVLAKFLKTGIRKNLSSRSLQILWMIWFTNVNPLKVSTGLPRKWKLRKDRKECQKLYFRRVILTDITKLHSRKRPGVHSISLLIKLIRESGLIKWIYY